MLNRSKRKNSSKGGMPFPKSISIPEITTLSSDYDVVTCVAIHPTLPFIVTGHEFIVNIWRFLPDGSFVQTPVATIEAYSQNYVQSVAFHPTLPLLATGSDLQNNSEKRNGYSTVKLWRFLPDGSAVQTPVRKLRDTRYTVMSLDFNPQGNLLASGNEIGTVNLWRVYPDGSTDETPVASLLNPNIIIFSVKFHPKLSLLATATGSSYGYNTVKLWRVNPDGSADQTPVATLRGHSQRVQSVAFHRTLPLLATGSKDNTAKLWRLKSDGSGATPVSTLEGHKSVVYSVAFHPTLPLLATCSTDSTVKLWRFEPDGSGATPMATLDRHTSWINSVVFDPKGHFLVTGSYDSTAKVWDLSKIDKYLRRIAITRTGLTSRLIKAFTTGSTTLVGQTARLDYSNEVLGRVGNPPDLSNPADNSARQSQIKFIKYLGFPRAEALALPPILASQPVLPSNVAATAVEFPSVSSVCRPDDADCSAVYDTTFWDIVKEMYNSCSDSSVILKKIEELKGYRALLIEQGKPPGITSIWIKNLEKKIKGCRN